MKRKVVSLLIISLPLLLAAIMLQLPATGAPAPQSVPAAEEETVLPQPHQIVIRQQVPVSFTLALPTAITGTASNTTSGNLLGALVSSITRSANLTPTGTIQTELTQTVEVQTVVVTFTLDLQLTVTDTLTTTVPSTITLTLADQQTATVPISVTVGPAPQALVAITLLAPLDASVTAESPITETAEITPSASISVGVGAEITPTAAITGTIAITANLRSGPDTTFDAVDTVTAGQIVTVAGQNADGAWYLVNNGLWIAAFLVENTQGEPPVATEELVAALRAQNAITATTPVTPTAPVTVTAAPTTTGPILVPTPTTAPQAVQPPRVTLDANLRSGPGTTFPIIGGTITGQELNIVARNEDGSWFQLDNGGWVAAFLVADPPAAADVPLFTEGDGATGEAGNITPTATPIPTPTQPPTSTTPILGVRENLYVIRVDGIVDGYDFSLTKIDQLVTQAGARIALLQDRAWIVEMTTAITLLRSTSDEVRALAPPPIFVSAHNNLLQAATSFATAADLLAEGVDQLDTDRLDEAFAEITVGSSLLTRAQNAIDAAKP